MGMHGPGRRLGVVVTDGLEYAQVYIEELLRVCSDFM
jgi:hypothetical protein